MNRYQREHWLSSSESPSIRILEEFRHSVEGFRFRFSDLLESLDFLSSRAGAPSCAVNHAEGCPCLASLLLDPVRERKPFPVFKDQFLDVVEAFRNGLKSFRFLS